MNKNIIIWILGGVIVLAGGYYLLKNKSPNSVAVYQPPVTSNAPPAPKPTPTPAPTPVVSAPEVVTDQVASVSSSTAVVSGKVKPNGASTTYWFDYGETTALGTRTITQAVGSGYMLTLTPAYITGLKANTPYYFRLSAKNKIATVAGDTFTFKTNNNPPTQALAPTAKTTPAVQVSRVMATMNGQVNPNGFTTSYWFEYGRDANLGNVTSLQSAGSGTSPMNVSIALASLDPLTRYYFRINAQSQYGTVNGATLTFTTQGPPAPSAPKVDTAGASSIGSSGSNTVQISFSRSS